MEWGGGGAVSSGKTDKCHLKRRYALTLWQFKLYVSDTKKLALGTEPWTEKQCGVKRWRFTLSSLYNEKLCNIIRYLVFQLLNLKTFWLQPRVKTIQTQYCLAEYFLQGISIGHMLLLKGNLSPDFNPISAHLHTARGTFPPLYRGKYGADFV